VDALKMACLRLIWRKNTLLEMYQLHSEKRRAYAGRRHSRIQTREIQTKRSSGFEILHSVDIWPSLR